MVCARDGADAGVGGEVAALVGGLNGAWRTARAPRARRVLDVVSATDVLEPEGGRGYARDDVVVVDPAVLVDLASGWKGRGRVRGDVRADDRGGRARIESARRAGGHEAHL
eukprot:729026-Prymnesium_polylepis.1